MTGPATEVQGGTHDSATTRKLVVGGLTCAVVGFALLALGWARDTERAWFSYLDAWTFGTTVSIGALLLLMIGHVAKAGWMVVTRRLTEAIVAGLPLYFGLFVPIAVGAGHLYSWAAPLDAASPELRRAIEHTRPYLNVPFFVARTVFYFVVFITVGALLSAWSEVNDRKPRTELVRRMRRLSGGALPLVGLVVTWAAFDWTMSLEPAWSSTIFGLEYFAGSFVAAIALVASVLGWSSSAEPSHTFTPDHAQAVGRVLFAMVTFWAYMAFSQLLIYWIADLPSEIGYYAVRMTGTWKAVTFALVFGNFFFPFFALLSRSLKRRRHYLAFIAAWVFVMHYVDVYWMIMPVHDVTGVHPHWLDAAAILFIGGLSCALTAYRYARLPRLPLHVPELSNGLDYEAAA